MRNDILLAAALCALPGFAFAHVTLAQTSAAPGAHYVAHFRVGHGCSGSPTTALSIAIPDGVSAVVPQPAPGWTIEIAHAGTNISTITWTGGPLAADAKGDFIAAMTLPATKTVLAFKATQTCAVGSESWSELPGTGQKSAHPAPVLYVGEDAPRTDSMAPGMVMPDGSHM